MIDALQSPGDLMRQRFGKLRILAMRMDLRKCQSADSNPILTLKNDAETGAATCVDGSKG